jgi:hypothetical protein
VFANGTLFGGSGGIRSGESLTTTAHLDSGEYVMFCEIPSPSTGIPHAQQGIVSQFSVDGDAGEPAEVVADSTITISTSDYQIPEGFDETGRVLVVNDFQGPAEATIFRLSEGERTDQVVRAGARSHGGRGAITALALRGSRRSRLLNERDHRDVEGAL